MEGSQSCIQKEVCGHLKLNEIHKITGGKYKKHKQGKLTRINNTYSDVECYVEGEIPGTKCLLDFKVKNCYLHPLQDNIIEMPEADNLLVVENLDEHLKNVEMIKKEENNATKLENIGKILNEPIKENVKVEIEDEETGALDKIIDELNENKSVEKVYGKIEIDNQGNEVDNITDVLPSMTEALELREDNLRLREMNKILQVRVDEANAGIGLREGEYREENKKLKEAIINLTLLL